MKSKRKPIPSGLAHQVRDQCDSACANPSCRQWNTSTHELHHIDGDRSSTTLENLILLCANCHSKEQAGIITQDEIAIWKARAKLGNLPLPKEIMPASTSIRAKKIVVNFHPTAPKPPPKSKYPKNAIGSDANLVNYIDYLFGLAIEYWEGAEGMNAGRLGKKIKTKFRLKLRTRNHLSVERFEELVEFIIEDLLKPSPAGKRHLRQGTKLCRTLEEFRFGPM